MPPTNLSRDVSPRFSRSLRVAVTECPANPTALLRRLRLAPCQTVTAAGPGGGATPNHFSCIFAIVAARAQQPAMPVIGYLYSGAAETSAPWVAAFRKGLSEVVFLRAATWKSNIGANNEPERLPELAADLVRRHVTVIAAIGGNSPTLAAKAATTTLPIVFYVGTDPVDFGLVASLNRPGGRPGG
jgi:ABC transporter substrate binding protein